MSYDAKNSHMKYYDFGVKNLMDNSMDRIHKRKMVIYCNNSLEYEYKNES